MISGRLHRDENSGGTPTAEQSSNFRIIFLTSIVIHVNCARIWARSEGGPHLVAIPAL